MNQYAKNFNRIADCVERRAQLLRRHPRLIDVAEQLSIRGRVFRRATVNAEISSIRWIMRNATHDQNVGLMLHEDVLMRDWITRSTPADLEETLAHLELTMGEILDAGEALISRDLEQIDADATIGHEEAIDILAGRAREDIERFDQKAQRYLTWRDLRSIELELSSHDPMQGILSLKEDKPANIEGLLRIFMTVMWFTGMRPTEVWNCVLFVPRPDVQMTPQIAAAIRKSPEKALLAGLLAPVHEVAKEVGETNLGTAAWNACFTSGAPCVLMIRSAKQTNANNAKRAVRLQVLEKIPREQLNLIALASILMYCPISEKRRDNIRSSMGRTLKRIVSRDPAFEGMRINLYSFRHSFVSRVKLVYSQSEAAALTGHTSRASLYVYGERNLRSGKGKVKPDQWLPSPDPERATLIQQHWDRGLDMGPEEPELDQE